MEFEESKGYEFVLTGDESWFVFHYPTKEIWIMKGEDIPAYNKNTQFEKMFTIFKLNSKLAYNSNFLVVYNFFIYLLYLFQKIVYQLKNIERMIKLLKNTQYLFKSSCDYNKKAKK